MAYIPPENITTSIEIFQWINTDLAQNMLFPGILFAVFIIMLVRLMYQDTVSRAFASASFICMILSVLLRAADLLDTTIMVIFIILTAVGAVWMHVENTKYG